MYPVNTFPIHVCVRYMKKCNHAGFNNVLNVCSHFPNTAQIFKKHTIIIDMFNSLHLMSRSLALASKIPIDKLF